MVAVLYLIIQMIILLREQLVQNLIEQRAVRQTLAPTGKPHEFSMTIKLWALLDDEPARPK